MVGQAVGWATAVPHRWLWRGCDRRICAIPAEDLVAQFGRTFGLVYTISGEVPTVILARTQAEQACVNEVDPWFTRQWIS